MTLKKLVEHLLIPAICLSSTLAIAGGNGVGNGGDPSEMRFNDIRVDLLNWIAHDGARSLNMPSRLSYQFYVSQMTTFLEAHQVNVTFISTLQEMNSDYHGRRVVISGQPKTCINYTEIASDGREAFNILCNLERFSAAGEADQYRLVHHEYAGLAGIENNLGQASDYEISSQITTFLEPQTVLRLAIRNNAIPPCDQFSDAELSSKDVGFSCRSPEITIRSLNFPEYVRGGRTFTRIYIFEGLGDKTLGWQIDNGTKWADFKEGRFTYREALRACPPGTRLPTREETRDAIDAGINYVLRDFYKGFWNYQAVVSDRGTQSEMAYAIVPFFPNSRGPNYLSFTFNPWPTTASLSGVECVQY